MERRKEEERAAPCIVAILPVLCPSPSHVGIFCRCLFTFLPSAVQFSVLCFNPVRFRLLVHHLVTFILFEPNKTFFNLKNKLIFNISIFIFPNLFSKSLKLHDLSGSIEMDMNPYQSGGLCRMTKLINSCLSVISI